MALSLLETFRSRPDVARIVAALRATGRRALDILYPPACLACRKATAAHHALCPACWGEMRFIERPYCERLGTPFAQDMRSPGLISPEAMAGPPVFGRAAPSCAMTMGRRAGSSIASNTVIASNLPAPWERGWRAPGLKSSRRPT